MTLTVTTQSGTQYQFNDETMTKVRRVPGTFDDPDTALRRDGEWLDCRILNDGPTVGQPIVFVLEPLGDLPITIRTTSPVVRIDGVVPTASTERVPGWWPMAAPPLPGLNAVPWELDSDGLD